MEKVTLSFSAKGQSLTGCPFKFASNTVNYIEAKFELGENWGGFDSVRAVWFTDFNCISTVLDTDGVCVVPHEVLNKAKREVKVNLVGSIVENGELTDRLTTYPIKAIIIDANAKICGSETAEVTPSQFEQFVEAVKAEVAKIKDIDSVELNDDYTLTIYFSDDTETTVGPIRGEQGPAGPQGEQGETGNGIASIEKTGTAGYVDTYTITFTDGTTTTFEVRNGEVSLETLESLMPIDTASGAIASFPDGQNVFPLKSLVADIDPIQDLHGYDAPWVGGAGKNKIPYPYTNTPVPSEITVTDNGDGTLTLNGTTTGNNYYWFFGSSSTNVPSWVKTSTTYRTGVETTGNQSDVEVQFIFYGKNGATTVVIDANPNQTPSDFTNYRLGIVLLMRVGTYSNVVVKPQLVEGSSISSWTPYSNICPISGHDEVDVVHTGVNVWDEELEQGDITTATGLPITADYGFRTKNFIPVLPNTQYYNKCPSRTEYARLWYYDADKNFISYNGGRANDLNAVITTPQNAYYMKFTLRYASYGTTYNNDISINYPSTDHDYHAYNGQTYTTTLPSTTYGGTLDVVSGVLTVTMVSVDLSTFTFTYASSYSAEDRAVWYVSCNGKGADTSLPANCLSEKYEVAGTGATLSRANVVGIASNSTPNRIWCSTTSQALQPSGQFVYELATPQTYQLTPQEIQTLLGVNNIWADSGDVEVVYIADIKLYVDNH